MSSSKKTFLFAGGMCLLCSFILALAANGLKTRQDLNAKLDKQKNILIALDLAPKGKSLTNDEVMQIYQKQVTNMWMTDSGALVKEKTNAPLFVRYQDDEVVSYAIPISGYGLWSTIYGYLGMSKDGKTVIGITFYQHGETPGLGGEVEKTWFTRQFVGKSIVDQNGQFVSVGVVKGKVEERIPPNQQANYVDGISGATVTSQGVDKFLNADLKKYEPFSRYLRGV